MNEYSLYGYINFLNITSGFVTPIFESAGSFWSQVELDNKVEKFIEIPKRHEGSISKDQRIKIASQIGDWCIYGYLHFNKMYYGTPGQLARDFTVFKIETKKAVSFLEKHGYNEDDSKALYSRKLIMYKNTLEDVLTDLHASKGWDIIVLILLSEVNSGRHKFYHYLKDDAIAKQLEIAEFITRNESISSRFVMQIDSMRTQVSKGYQVNQFLDPIVYYDILLENRLRQEGITLPFRKRIYEKNLIKQWLAEEWLTQKVYVFSLELGAKLLNEFQEELKAQLHTLHDSYKQLKELFFERLDINV